MSANPRLKNGQKHLSGQIGDCYDISDALLVSGGSSLFLL
jgi:hypothetical protein